MRGIKFSAKSRPSLQYFVGLVPTLFNLATPSQDFVPNSVVGAVLSEGWEKSHMSVSTGFVAPNGTTTAQKLVEDATLNPHVIFGPNSFGWNANTLFTGIRWRAAALVKPAGRNRIVLGIAGSNDQGVRVGFDLVSGNFNYDV